MPNSSGKLVHYLRVMAGITRGWISPILHNPIVLIHKTSVQLPFIHDLSDRSTPNLSPPFFRRLPLIEHYLYPVSTAPINNPTKRN
jgi:hypothetical protein